MASKKQNQKHAKKISLKWDGKSCTTKDNMRASRRNYGCGLAK